MTESVETLVVGAGIAGLAYAHARGSRADLLLLEAEPQSGGWIRTQRGGPQGDLRFEHGPEALPSGSEAMRSLASELGLELCAAAPAASKRFIALGGKLVALPAKPQELLSTPLLSGAGKLRLASERFRDPRKALDGSIAEFVEHRFGREVLEKLADPFVSGVWAGDARQISLRAALPQVVEMLERHKSLLAALAAKKGGPPLTLVRPRGGMAELPRALERSLAGRLRTGVAARSLARDGDGWSVETAGGTIRTHRLVLAVPAPAAARLLEACAPEIARELATLACESLAAVVHAWPRDRVRHPLDGFGYLVPSREKELQLGTLFSSSIDPGTAPPGRVLLRTLLGGARNPRAVELADSELAAAIRTEVAPLLGLEGEPEFLEVVRYRSALPRYDLDHPRRTAAIDGALARLAGLHLLGNFLRGIGVTQLVARSREIAAAHSS